MITNMLQALNTTKLKNSTTVKYHASCIFIVIPPNFKKIKAHTLSHTHTCTHTQLERENSTLKAEYDYIINQYFVQERSFKNITVTSVSILKSVGFLFVFLKGIGGGVGVRNY